LTIQGWADAAGLSWRSLQRYLDGERQPRIEDLDALAQVLGMRASDLLARAERTSVPRVGDSVETPPAELSDSARQRVLDATRESEHRHRTDDVAGNDG
jgi:transcriptional regulator with XRE-family HTH domain